MAVGFGATTLELIVGGIWRSDLLTSNEQPPDAVDAWLFLTLVIVSATWLLFVYLPSMGWP